MLAAAAGFLAIALTIRALAAGTLNSTGRLEQYSGTALYASMAYAGVLLLWPRRSPVAAGMIAWAWCWTMECFQLTGIPADLSARSLVARLVLGVQFDPVDLLWYLPGIIPLVVLHELLDRSKRPRKQHSEHRQYLDIRFTVMAAWSAPVLGRVVLAASLGVRPGVAAGSGVGGPATVSGPDPCSNAQTTTSAPAVAAPIHTLRFITRLRSPAVTAWTTGALRSSTQRVAPLASNSQMGLPPASWPTIRKTSMLP